MQGLLQSHTQWYNWTYDKVGHLFQGRYKAILCDRNTYLLELVKYIHLNPARAGYKNPMNYLWSSHRYYLDSKGAGLINPQFVLSMFAPSKKSAVELYEEFMKEGIGEGSKEEFYKVKDQRVLGDDVFFDEVMEKTQEPVKTEDRMTKDKTLEEVAKKVFELTGVNEKELRGWSRSKKVIRARSIFIHLNRLWTHLACKEVASFLNRQPTALSYIANKITETKIDKILDKLKW